MTPSTVIDIALDNVGLGSTTDRVNRARHYLNQTGQRIYSWSQRIGNTQRRQSIKWEWAFKEATLSLSSGTRGYSLAADVLQPYEYFDTTNNNWVPMDLPSTIDKWDPDEDNTGSPERVVVTGRNASTGYWAIDVYPTPSATTAVRYRYYAQWVDLTSTDDSTDLNPKLPEWLQPALIEGVTEMYLREKVDLENADIHRRVKEDIINNAAARNYDTAGRIPLRLERPSRRPSISVREGSLG